MITPHDPMEVRRVATSRESHIEPELDLSWSELDQLRWKAGVVSLFVGTPVRVHDAAYMVNGRAVLGLFGYSVGAHSGGALTFRDMWCFLTGLELGAELAG
jgi:hypothetical protein